MNEKERTKMAVMIKKKPIVMGEMENYRFYWRLNDQKQKKWYINVDDTT